MTDLQEDLTAAFERRANDAIAEDNLDAILTGTNIIRFSDHDDSSRRGGALLAVAASAAVLIGAAGIFWATNARTESPASSAAPAGPADAAPNGFPNEVPRPDTFDSMQIMTDDGAPVGFEFYDQEQPTDSVERCTQYASLFDQNWTSTADTDEAPEVLYAQTLDNTRWNVGIYCNKDGGYLVQVMPTGTNPNIADLMPTDSTDPNAVVDTVYSGSDDADIPADTVYSGLDDSNIPADTAPQIGADLTDDLVSGPPATIPDAFPGDVPKPDTFDTLQIMQWDNAEVGWEFYEQGEPTDSVERCTQYASSFDQTWTSTADTDEAPEVLYARTFDNTQWDVGVYCTEDGGYLVQVMPAGF